MTRAAFFALTVLIVASASWSEARAQGAPPPGYGPVPGPIYVEDPGLYGYPSGPTGPTPANSTAGLDDIERIFENPFSVSDVRFRTEYLNWTISDPGDVLLGAPILGNGDPRTPFPVVDPGGVLLGTAIIPDTSDLKLRNNSGIRGTLALDLTYGGSLEVSGFLLDKADSSYTLRGQLEAIPGQPFDFIGTSTFVNGQLSNNIELYNQRFTATYTSRFLGAGTDFVFDGDSVGLFQFRPLIGARYLELREQLTQIGLFRDTTFLDPITTTTLIDSRTENKMAGGQIGFRTSLGPEWFQIGFEPKFGLMANAQTAVVASDNFRSNLDPFLEFKKNNTSLMPMIELGVHAQSQIRSWLTLRVGYNFLWLGRVTRPEDNIFYNDNGPLPTVQDIRLSGTRHSINVQGLTTGVEFKW